MFVMVGPLWFVLSALVDMITYAALPRRLYLSLRLIWPPYCLPGDSYLHIVLYTEMMQSDYLSNDRSLMVPHSVWQKKPRGLRLGTAIISMVRRSLPTHILLQSV